MNLTSKTIALHIVHGLALFIMCAIVLGTLWSIRVIRLRDDEHVFETAAAVVVVYYLARLFWYTLRQLSGKMEPPTNPPVDPKCVADGYLNWLDVKHRRFLRRNGEGAAGAAIILGGIKLAQHRGHAPETPAPFDPAPILNMYRDHFGRWGSFKIVRFADRIAARLVNEPAGHIIYRNFARKVLKAWQLKAMLDSIDKFAPEPTKFIHGGVE
jgi:hypothetical protein